MEEDGIGAQVEGGGGGSGAPGGGRWDRGTCREEEEDQGHLGEEDGIGAQEEEDPGHLVEEDGIGAQVEKKRRRIRGTWWRRMGLGHR